MIDVLLVLIIIFMVVVTMSNQMGLEAHIPRSPRPLMRSPNQFVPS